MEILLQLGYRVNLMVAILKLPLPMVLVLLLFLFQKLVVDEFFIVIKYEVAFLEAEKNVSGFLFDPALH